MTRLRSYLHDIRTLPADAMLGYRNEGARGVWKSVAARSLHRLVRGGRLIVFAHPLEVKRDLELPAGVAITSASEQDWTALAGMVGQRELSRFGALHAKGRRCLIAWRGNKPVGYAWVANEIGPDVTLWPFPVQFPRTAAYLWNLYVLPSERSSGIGSALAHARLQLAREMGFREAWRMVAPSNTASLRTVRKSATATRVVGNITFIQLLNRTYARFTPYAVGA